MTAAAPRLPVAELETFFRDLVAQEVARVLAERLPSIATEPEQPEWVSIQSVAALLDMTVRQARLWLDRTPEVNAKRRFVSGHTARYPRALILAYLSSTKAPDSVVAMAARRSA